MKLTGLSIIGDRRGARGKSFTGINPMDGSVLPGEFYSASLAEVDEVAWLASGAFAVYSQWSSERRLGLLKRIAELLEANAAEIVERAQLETGLSASRLEGELTRTCFQLRLYGEAAANGLCAGVRIDHGDPGRKPHPKPDLRSMLIPLGPVAVFGASNFPLAYSVAGGDTASALAAGCPVIVKAHPAHPGTSELVGLLVEQGARECGAPAGTFSLLFDADFEVGAALVKHTLVKAVGFTGSRRGGRALMDLAAARAEPIPVYTEMSSINPVFILDGALKERADEIATGLHDSVTLGLGQFCTKPGLIFLEAGEVAEKFIFQLEKLMKETSPGAMLTSGIGAAYQAGVKTLAKAGGVTLAAMGKDGSGFSKTQAQAALFVTDAKTFLANQALAHEVFGPATLLIECSSCEQMLMAAQELEGQLTATVQATERELAVNRELVRVLTTKAGRLIFNGFPTGVEVTHAMTHGGPYPATADGRSTSVGTRAVERFARPITYQNFPDAALPPELQEANPLGISRLCDGKKS